MDWANVNRQKKVLAMVALFDALFVERYPNLDPYDQAGRIADATREWTDEHWHQLAKRAGYTSTKPPGETTRAMFVEVYRGRSRAPLAARSA